jgi:TonB family protein
MLRPVVSPQRKAGADLKKGKYPMRLSVASFALAAAFVLMPVTAGYAPALCQDFSITNQVEGNAARRDLMRQLQAWWDAHAYYPRHASNNDESGTVKVHLVILPDGRIWRVDMVEGSGSPSLDTAAPLVFREGFVRPFPQGEPQADIDLSLHYVLAHRHDEPVAAGYKPVSSKGPFTITNDAVKSPILETMLQKNCTGTQVLGGVANHPIYGQRSWIQAIFFRKPDGTPWVKFYQRGYPVLAPVTEIGKMVTWTGPREIIGGGSSAYARYLQYTAWADGDNHLIGAVGSRRISLAGVLFNQNLGGNWIELTCETEVLPVVTWNDWLATPLVIAPYTLSTVDPP